MRQLSIERALVLVFALAMMIAAAGWWSGRRELQAMTVANDFLRKTLGDMTVTIVAKDREIDRLQQTPCVTPDKPAPRPQSGPGPHAQSGAPQASEVGTR